MNDSTRRTFIKAAAAVTAASQAHIFGANDRIRIGGIGTGGRGQYLLSVLSKLPGNEIVAVFRIRVGREINSAALVADGYHARTDGLTSLAVVAGALGSG